MTIAKALGSGMPIGALLTTADIAAAFTPGSHGTTFGGNPVACAAAVATMTELAKPELLAHVRQTGDYFRQRLEALRARHPMIQEVRGAGLMLGAVLDRPGQAIVDACRERGLLINCTAERVLRFVPPLILTRAHVDEGFDLLAQGLSA